MSVIKWNIGHENRTIVEESDYEESIFFGQYRQACRLLEGFVNREIDDTLQIIAFCGERGSGKTSSMQSVMKIIAQTQTDKSDRTENFFHKAKLEKLQNRLKDGIRRNDLSFEIPEMIDPSFFDRENNIIELLIGQIYGDLREYERAHKSTIDRILLNKIYDSLSEIKECLLTLHGSDEDRFSGSTELSVLSNAVKLKKSVRALVKDYLRLKGRRKLLVSVDDLDLNRDGAYEMCEQIRKYLAMPECVVFLSFNYSQLVDSLTSALENNATYGGDERHADTLRLRAIRYLDKLVASGERVHTPQAYNLCNRELRIYEEGRIVPNPGGETIVKDVVVSLIFQKTRFLFYNNKGGVSPILPNNLRE
ncbi:MAG: hypothetical protein K2J15_01860, partial [Muribaculaceae bacterium]|nr:hypothetical protein [Muribaculaceae bacterium]